MADEASDFPTLANETGISPGEREEIASQIERIATENRIPVEAAQFSLQGARRGALLPVAVNLAACVLAVSVILVLGTAYRRGEERVQAQETQYSSIEGKLIRELRREAQQRLSAKEQEIASVREQLRRLEIQQQDLERSFEEKLKVKEEEFRTLLLQEIEAERARLATQGIGQADIDLRIRRFEEDRKAYYDRQLAAYRKQLETERAQLQADIDRLRSEYTARLTQLEAERRRIVSDFEQRETSLRLQLEQKTQVLERLRAESLVDLESAQKELAGLARTQELARSVENQIDGFVDRIRRNITAGDASGALEGVRALSAYLGQDSVRSVGPLAGRIRSEVFLAAQLETLLEQKLRTEAAAGDRSIAGDLEILGLLRSLSAEASTAGDESARLDLYRSLLASLPEIRAAHEAVSRTAVAVSRDEDRKAFDASLRKALEEQRERIFRDETEAVRAAAQERVEYLNEQLSDRDARLADLSEKHQASESLLGSLAARASTTPENFARRLAGLIEFENQVRAAKEAYADYVRRESEARTANPADPITASRQELNRFLRGEAVRPFFSDLADRVNALYASVQSAGSSAALADAARILSDIAGQPSLSQSRQRLQFEISQLGRAEEELAAILRAVDSVLAKAEAAP